VRVSLASLTFAGTHKTRSRCKKLKKKQATHPQKLQTPLDPRGAAMRATRCILCTAPLSATRAAQGDDVYRFDFSLEDQPLSGELTSNQDLWQLAADFVARRGWRLEEESRA